MRTPSEFLTVLEKGFIKTYRVSPYETDGVGRLKIGSIFNWLQDSMDEYSTHLGVGASYCQTHNISYVLRGYDVTVNTLPTRGMLAPVHTNLACLTPASFVLQQTMYDGTFKNTLLSACSQVVLLNMSNGRLAKADECLPNYITRGVASKPYFLPAMPNQERIDRVQEEVVPWDYIDFNQHVNNAKYVDLASRGLSSVLLKKMQLKRIAIAFKRAATCGERLQVHTQEDSNASIHKIVSQEQNTGACAKVYFSWNNQDSRCR